MSHASDVLTAIGRSVSVIEFDPIGNVIDANDNFCRSLGYDIAEIKGKHHRIFVTPDDAAASAYAAFWAKLGRGDNESGEYKRVGKNGRDVWIQASYNPVRNAAGRVTSIVKIATDVTTEKLKAAEDGAKLTAISRVQAIIEFTPAGDIITANENFLGLMGYSLDEIRARHHRIFVDPDYAASPAYQAFWRTLNSGDYVSASFQRIARGGKPVWIQASYNPIFDLNAHVSKIVKFATDITDLTEIGSGLSRLSAKNLETKITRTFSPAFGRLREDFNIAHDILRETVRTIATSAMVIQEQSKQIFEASEDLSERTERQAASLEQAAAALDEITATVKKSADGAAHARQIVNAADDDARNSSVVVTQAVGAMDQIAQSARQIERIIGVIDEIAFQTSLLALNAGVEAARAGDAGRGFAVVASEVRALAQRTAEAAKEIKGLISSSSGQVDEGVKLVAETGDSLARIVGQVAEINRVVGEIANGSREQAAGLAEINIAFNQMDRVTQDNARLVESSTASMQSLALESAKLSAIVAEFRFPAREDAPAESVPKSRPVASLRTEPASAARGWAVA